jgi:hypothetical protein
MIKALQAAYKGFLEDQERKDWHVIKNQKYGYSEIAISCTVKYVLPSQQPDVSWHKPIFAVSTFGNEPEKSKEEMEEEQAWEAYQEVKKQFYHLSQMLADS